MLQIPQELLTAISDTDRDILNRYGWFSQTHTTEPDSNNPGLTIGILTHNRRNDLRMVLTLLVYLDRYPHKQIIVVDNASTDGTGEMLRTQFPTVEYIRLEQNIGTAGRNLFYRMARHDYVFSLDDDSIPATPTTLLDMVAFLEAHPAIDTVSAAYLQPRIMLDETLHFASIGVKHTDERWTWHTGFYNLEGGSCTRRDAWLHMGGYSDGDDFWGADGIDIQLGFYLHDSAMAWLPSTTVLHFKQWSGRTAEYNAFRKTQNSMKLLAKRFTMPLALILGSLFILRRSVEMLRRPSRIKNIIRGLISGIKASRRYHNTSPKITFRSVWGVRQWIYSFLRW